MGVIGILGGTFDPVHCGHLRLGIEMLERLALRTVRLLPAGAPQLRDAPRASATQRLDMLELATRGISNLEVDRREVERDGPTYTVETLEAMRAELDDTPVCLLIGLDAFARLEAWHRWTELFELCHIAVAHRAGAHLNPSDSLAHEVKRRRCAQPALLAQRPAGYVIDVAVPLLDISATQIRAATANGLSICGLVPPDVADYIAHHRLYSASSE